MFILGIESSCDETAAAVVKDGREICSSVISSQIAEHSLYGGVVPEIASRRHIENISEVVEGALQQANLTMSEIDAIAVTTAPGLIGALLVGVNFAKGLALAYNKPLVPVHHIRGHVASNYLAYPEMKPPFICLVASGGHSNIMNVKGYTEFEIIGRTRDDAAGEAFDKAARAMGFPYPGGVSIDKHARLGDHKAYKLPNPKVDGYPYDYSFSGLKTSVLNLIHNAKQKGQELDIPSLCASFEYTVATALTSRLIMAAKEYGTGAISVAGGVSANTGLREMLIAEAKKNNLTLYMPPLNLCGDNACMIAAQGYHEFLKGEAATMGINAVATMSVENVTADSYLV